MSNREKTTSFAGELRRTAREAPKRRRQADIDRTKGVIDKWYQECREEARTEAAAGRRVAYVGTGYPLPPSEEDSAMLKSVVQKLCEDGLKASLQVVESTGYSEDTDSHFEIKNLVFVMRW